MFSVKSSKDGDTAHAQLSIWARNMEKHLTRLCENDAANTSDDRANVTVATPVTDQSQRKAAN